MEDQQIYNDDGSYLEPGLLSAVLVRDAAGANGADQLSTGNRNRICHFPWCTVPEGTAGIETNFLFRIHILRYPAHWNMGIGFKSINKYPVDLFKVVGVFI